MNKTKKNIQLINNVNLKSLAHSDDFIHAFCNKLTIKSKLIIAADGKHSTVRHLLKTLLFCK